MPIHSRQKEDTVPKLIRRLLLAWLLAITLESLLLPTALRNLSGLEGLAKMSLPRVCALTCGGFLLLEAADKLKKQKNAATYYKRRQRERWAISGLFLLDAALSLIASFTWAFLGTCVLLMGILAHYARCGWNGTLPSAPAQRKESPVWLWLLVALTIAFCIFDSFWTIARIRSFSTPTYDFGIFSQMFYNMRKTGLPMTTLERDGLLSHFAVHVSPIWYLMLPFYWLVPKPETLQVLQAIILASSVIPFWKICKLHGLSAPTRFFLCAALLLYPSFSGGTSYDVHENCFLTPLILWLLYGIDRKRTGIAAVAAILTLCVKEDAATYVAVIAIWLIVRSLLSKTQIERKSLWLGLVLLAGSILWFLAVTAWLTKAGDGVMTYRYSNFMYDGSNSLITVIKSVLLQPFKALYECVDAEKLSFLGLSLLPLLGLPLWTRRYERFLLLIPFILVNLMSDYQYQHDIFFQYTFGSTACLFYLTAVNLEDWRPNWTKAAGGIAAVVLCAACFGFMVVPKAATYFQKCTTYSAYYDQLREELSRIPKDASVSATTFYTTQLSQREILYDVKYASFEHLLETDYIVLAVSEKTNYTKYASSSADDGLDRLVKRLEKNGYEQISTRENVILIFRKK